MAGFQEFDLPGIGLKAELVHDEDCGRTFRARHEVNLKQMRRMNHENTKA